MARDNAGNYSLPAGYLAVTGEFATATEHNAPLEDLAAAVSGSLPVNGAKAMSGPIKLADGTVSAPGMAFNTDQDTGLYKTDDGFGVAVGGTKVAEFGAAGLIVGGTPVGLLSPYAGSTAPDRWLLCDGSAVSRTTYSALFTVISTTYGTGDGSTTFNVPDLGGRVVAGKESTATRLTTAGSGVDGATLGDTGGDQTVSVLKANLPSYNLAVSIPSGQGSHAHTTVLGTSSAFTNGPGPGSQVAATTSPSGSTAVINSATLPAMNGTAATGGSGTALNVTQPTIVCNYIIFAGA